MSASFKRNTIKCSNKYDLEPLTKILKHYRSQLYRAQKTSLSKYIDSIDIKNRYSVKSIEI